MHDAVTQQPPPPPPRIREIYAPRATLASDQITTQMRIELMLGSARDQISQEAPI